MTKKALGLADFIELLQDHQLDILHQDGVYVGKRKVSKQTVVLYQLYGFYVEVFYKHYRKKVDHLITSATTEILQPYMNQIHVRDLNIEETDLPEDSD